MVAWVQKRKSCEYMQVQLVTAALIVYCVASLKAFGQDLALLTIMMQGDPNYIVSKSSIESSCRASAVAKRKKKMLAF